MHSWKDKFGNAIMDQMKRLGLSLNWNELYFTLDTSHNEFVKKAFHKFYEDGLIYRDDRIVNYCPFMETMLSDWDVDHLEIKKPTKLNLPCKSE